MSTNERSLGPLIQEALLTELKRRFPNRIPALDTSDRELWALAGEQRLIDFLQMQYDSAQGTDNGD